MPDIFGITGTPVIGFMQKKRMVASFNYLRFCSYKSDDTSNLKSYAPSDSQWKLSNRFTKFANKLLYYISKIWQLTELY